MSPSEKSIYTRICIHHTDEERATIKCPVCLAAENAALLELHTMQLAAVSTATVQNTETTIKDRIGPDNPYYTTAYGDTCRAVDREMRLLADNAALRAALEPFSHDDLCEQLGGNVQGENSPIFGRNRAVLVLGNFRRARAALVAHKNHGKENP